MTLRFLILISLSFTIAFGNISLSGCTSSNSQSPSPVKYFNIAMEKAKQGNNKEAIADLDKAILSYPEFSLAYAKRGFLKQELGDNKGAINDFNVAIKINLNWSQTDIADAYYFRGTSKFNLEDYKGAITDYNEAILVQPESSLNTFIYNERAIAKIILGDKQGAISDARTSIKLFQKYGYSDKSPEEYKKIIKFLKELESTP